MSIFAAIKHELVRVSQFIRNLYCEPYEVALNPDGTWRVVDRDGQTVESPLDSAHAAQLHIDDLKWSDRQV